MLLTGAKADERRALLAILDGGVMHPHHDGQLLLADKNYYGQEFENSLHDRRIELLRPARNGEPERRGHRFFKPLRQIIEF